MDGTIKVRGGQEGLGDPSSRGGGGGVGMGRGGRGPAPSLRPGAAGLSSSSSSSSVARSVSGLSPSAPRCPGGFAADGEPARTPAPRGCKGPAACLPALRGGGGGRDGAQEGAPGTRLAR